MTWKTYANHLHLRHCLIQVVRGLAMYVCLCKGVTDRKINQVVSDGARSWKEVREQTGCAMQCGKCACEAKQITKQAVLSAMSLANQDLAYAI